MSLLKQHIIPSAIIDSVDSAFFFLRADPLVDGGLHSGFTAERSEFVSFKQSIMS